MPYDYEEARFALQQAVIEWAQAGADRLEIEQEIQSTFDNAPDHYPGLDHLRAE